MKKQYTKPQIQAIALGDNLCDNGITMASVQHGDTGKTIDNINVVEESQSEEEYNDDWTNIGSWGGN